MKRPFPILVLALAAAGCAAETPLPITGVVIPALDTTPHKKAKRQAPPPSGPAKPYHFPKVAWADLSNGLEVAAIRSTALPIVQVRLVIRGGKAADADRPGLSGITARLMKDGGAGPMSSRELVTRIESLGAELSIDNEADATVLGLAVTKDRLADALDLLGVVVQRPTLPGAELVKLEKREADRLADAARAKGSWGAYRVLYEDLFSLPSEHHPYASWTATAEEVYRITIGDCRSFHKRFYVPKNAFLVIAGDTTPEEAKALAQKAFGGWSGGEPPTISFTEPTSPEARRITLVDRPRSSQSEIFVGAFGPERKDASFPAFAVAHQVLGGSPAARLFVDVREKQSLAYTARSLLTDLAHGPSVLVAYAGTQTAKTGLALEGLLSNLERLAASPASQEEVQAAHRFLSDTFAVKLETVGAVADELVHLHVAGLPDDYDDGYRKDVRAVTPQQALAAAAAHLRSGHEVVVVAGDAAVVGPMLSHFGPVKVVDPTHDFARIRSIPANPSAPLEVPRQEGR